MVISPPYEWQKRFNESDVSVESRIGRPVDPGIIAELLKKFTDFRRAYEEDGMKPEEFDSFGASARTLRQFCKATEDLAALMRDYMLPDPWIGTRRARGGAHAGRACPR